MSELANKDLVHRYYDEAFNARQPGLLDGMLAPGFVDHNPAPGQAPGAAGFKHLLVTYLDAFPDGYISLEDMLAERDVVAVRFIFWGTQAGAFRGVLATGRHVTVTGIDIFRVAGGRLTERWGNRDDLGFMQQLGAVPETVVAPGAP
jgi:predicted ester cyclase